MRVIELIESVRTAQGCRVSPPTGVPDVPYRLPNDLLDYFTVCGGLTLFEGAEYGINLVGPSDFVRANALIAGADDPSDISHDWYVVAVSDGQYVSIDLNADRLGRCYDSFWDRHAVAGSCSIVAMSFEEFFAKLVNGRGDRWFWLESGFVTYGDAYGTLR